MGRHGSRAPSRRRRGTPLIVGGVAALVLAGCAGWLGLGAWRAHTALAAARGHLEQARTAFLGGERTAATAELTRAAAATAAGRAETEAVSWRLAAAVPGLGRPFASARELAQAVDDLVVQVLQPAARAGAALDPAALRPTGRKIDISVLAGARQPLATASAAAAALDERVRRIPPAGIPAVDDARAGLQEQVTDLAARLQTGATATALLPPMLGADRPRRYLLAFQTNAEARGTGGLIGGFGLVTADRGEITLNTLASNRDLDAVTRPGVELGPDYDDQYAGYASTTLWHNANSSPHFPYAAQIWSSLWRQQRGQQLDGVLALDPVALEYVLAVTGPLRLPGGERVDAGNVVPITESEAYVRFRTDNAARKDYLQSIAAAAAAAVLGGAGPPAAVLGALGRATAEGRLAVWSAVPAEQELLGRTALGHEVPETAGPYASVVVLNGGESKLDYYLHRDVRYVAGDCSARHRRSAVTVELRNGAPTAPLPRYVAGLRYPPHPPNTNRLLVSLYATQGAQLSAVSLDGTPTTARVGAERGHPVFTTTLLIPPGATQRLVFDLVEPSSPGEPVVPVQPLVEPMGVAVRVPAC